MAPPAHGQAMNDSATDMFISMDTYVQQNQTFEVHHLDEGSRLILLCHFNSFAVPVVILLCAFYTPEGIYRTG